MKHLSHQKIERRSLIGRYVLMAMMFAGINGGAHAALGDGMKMGGGLASKSRLNIGAGSVFVMEVSPGFYQPTTVVNNNGLILGTAQPASGSHTGAPTNLPPESPGIDKPWLFFGNTGLDFTATPANVLSASGTTATIDLSGWRVTWNGISSINMGGNAWNDAPNNWSGNTNGVARVTCAVDCGDGDTYTLQYTATVPVGDPSGFGGVHYGIKSQGTIEVTAIPSPPSVCDPATDPTGCKQITPLVSRTPSSSGCSLSANPVNPLERGDWWLLLGFVAWLGVMAKRRRA